MKLFSKPLNKLKIPRTSLVSGGCLAVVFLLVPFGLGKLTVNEQGVAPYLSTLTEVKYSNWFEVTSLDGLALRSRSVVVVSLPSGRILGAKEPRRILPLASLTKLMTVKLVLDQGLNPENIILAEPISLGNRLAPYLSEDDAVSQIGLRRPESFREVDLLAATLVASANDAVLALAGGVKLTGHDFIQAVNQETGKLGLADTRILEPTGLNPANLSTAIEVASLARAVWQDNLARKLSDLGAVTIKSQPGTVYNLTNTNELFRQTTDFKILASKTGHLNEVGYNLAQIIKLRSGGTYLMVLLGAASPADRSHDAKILADWLSL